MVHIAEYACPHGLIYYVLMMTNTWQIDVKYATYMCLIYCIRSCMIILYLGVFHIQIMQWIYVASIIEYIQ